MFLIDYDAISGDAIFFGWALPGTPTSAAAWRIGQPIFSGTVMVEVRWPGGVDDFTHVWDDRASLVYVSNPNVALEVDVEFVPSGTLPGSTFTVPVELTPRNHETFLNGFRLKRVSGTPVPGEYAPSGTTLLTGRVIVSDDVLIVRVKL